MGDETRGVRGRATGAKLQRRGRLMGRRYQTGEGIKRDGDVLSNFFDRITELPKLTAKGDGSRDGHEVLGWTAFVPPCRSNCLA